MVGASYLDTQNYECTLNMLNKTLSAAELREHSTQRSGAVSDLPHPARRLPGPTPRHAHEQCQGEALQLDPEFDRACFQELSGTFTA